MMRIFIGLEINEEARDALILLQTQLKPYIDRGRLSRPENFHLTLRFLGEIHEDLLKLVFDAMEDAAHLYKGFDISLGNLGAFQKKNRKILWAGIGTGSDQMNALYDIIQKELKLIGIHPEEQSLNAHITLGRQIKLLDTVEDLKTRYAVDPVKIRISHITVFESTRINDVLTYVPIRRLELKS